MNVFIILSVLVIAIGVIFLFASPSTLFKLNSKLTFNLKFIVDTYKIFATSKLKKPPLMSGKVLDLPPIRIKIKPYAPAY